MKFILVKSIQTAVVILLAACLWPAAAHAQQWPVPFSASYELFEGDKKRGKVDISLQETAPGRYIYRSETKANAGLAGLVGATITEVSEFEMVGKNVRPLTYRYEQEVPFASRERKIDFDWTARTAHSRYKNESRNLNLEGGELDRLLAPLVMGRDLGSGADDMSYRVAERRRIDSERYRAGDTRTIDTGLGKLETIEVNRVRAANSDRATTSWHAPEVNWLPVAVRHCEDGKCYRTRLSQYQELSGTPATQ